MFCSKCGSEINDTAKFCPKCGAKTGSSTSAINIPTSLDANKIVSQTKSIVENAKLNLESDNSIIKQNKVIYFVGLGAFILQVLFYFFPMIRFEVLGFGQTYTIFGLWEEGDISISGFVKVFLVILYMISLISYLLPLLSKKSDMKKHCLLPLIVNILSFAIFAVTILVTYYGASNTDYGDFSNILSLKGSGWLYLIFFVISMVSLIILKKTYMSKK